MKTIERAMFVNDSDYRWGIRLYNFLATPGQTYYTLSKRFNTEPIKLQFALTALYKNGLVIDKGQRVEPDGVVWYVFARA